MGEKVGKAAINLLKIAAAAVAGKLLGDLTHKLREANTRKKAMDAALKENNSGSDKE